MLINLRNALMAGKRLPYDAEVEYLESTGTQYINTGITSDGVGLRADVVCEKTTSSTGEAGVVGRLSLGDGFELYIASGRCGLWNGSNGRSVVSSVSISQSTVYNISAEVTNSGASITINGTTNSASFTPISVSADYFIIFNHRGRYPFVGRIYSCKIWQNGVLVRDYIPVRKGTVGYLYDRVTGKLFGNAGTDDFVLGPDVVPVEYIDGDNYNLSVGANALCVIDTGIIPNLATDVWECDAQFVRFGSTAGCWGRTPNRFAFGRGSISWNDWYFGYGDTNNRTGAAYDTARHIFRLDAPNRTMSVDSATYNGTGNEVSGNDYTLGIFNRNNAYGITSLTDTAESKLYSSKFYRSGVLIQHLIPVRVGTDATSWEGAMMDTLTRRIYRNAGTGAFTYGNDLKYPIPAE